MKTDKEKAKAILKERERAAKGFAVTNDEGEDPLDEQPASLEEQAEREEKVDDLGLGLGVGLHRSG